jgi:glycine/D-amino acid oxidase-like deaminating enzyme
VFTPTGGVLFAARILEDLGRWLQRHDVPLHPHSRVVEVDFERAAIRVAEGGADRGDALVVAAGPWAPDLVPALRGRITPSRQVPLYLEPPSDLLAAWRAAPMVLDQFEAARGGFYAVPPVDGTVISSASRRSIAVSSPKVSVRGSVIRWRSRLSISAAISLALAST